MRASRILPLAICLLLALTRTVIAQTSPEPKTDSAPSYGIDPAKSYPGTTVLRLLIEAKVAGDAAIGDAYADGYKSGFLAAAPDRDYWKSLAQSKTFSLPWPAVLVTDALCLFGGMALDSSLRR